MLHTPLWKSKVHHSLIFKMQHTLHAQVHFSYINS